MRTIGLLAQASLPMGLLVVGAGLRLESLPHARGHLRYGEAVKLLALPALAWWLGGMLRLPRMQFEVAPLFAALPMSTVAYVLAVRMGGDGRTGGGHPPAVHAHPAPLLGLARA